MSIAVKNTSISALSITLPRNGGGCSQQQTASDLAYEAANEIYKTESFDKSNLGGIIFLTSTPDYRSPATAFILQKRLGLSTDIIAYDINQVGNSFNQGIQIASSLLENINANNFLLVYGETYSKIKVDNIESSIYPKDYAAAVLLEKSSNSEPIQFYFFSDTCNWDAISNKLGGYKNAKPQGDNLPYSNLENLGVLSVKIKILHQFQEKAFTNLVEFIPKPFNHIVSNFDENILLNYAKGSKRNNAFDNSFIPSGLEQQYQLQQIIKNNTSKVNEPLEVSSISYGEGLAASLMNFYISKNCYTSIVKSNHFYEEGDVSHEI